MRQTCLVAGLVVALAGCARTEAQIPDSQSLASADAPAPAKGAAAATPGSTASVDSPIESATREVTLPAGTLLPVSLSSSVGSDTSQVEDEVRATLRRAVTSNGVEVLPAGTTLVGHVTSAEHSGRVKGRASVAFRFTRVDLPGPAGHSSITSSPISRVAPATKKEDAMKIGGGAVGGAIIGGILGGGGGAAKGAAIGGTAGTGVVLATKGKEVHLGPGAALSVRLTAPLMVQVHR